MNKPLQNHPSDRPLRPCPIDQLADDIEVSMKWLAAEAERAKTDHSLDQLADDLEIFCDWRDRLQAELKRLILLWRLDLLPELQQDAIIAKVKTFKATVNRLAVTIKNGSGDVLQR